MPTKRTKIAPRRVAIPPAAIEAWRAGNWKQLHRELGLTPVDISPFDADRSSAETAAAWAEKGLLYFGTHRRAMELRETLIELAGEPGEQPDEAVVPMRKRDP